jgi:DNA-binding Lrp family transcriptional regulator
MPKANQIFNADGELHSTAQAVLKALQEDPYASDQKLAKTVTLSIETVRGWLTDLRAGGYVTLQLRLADLVKSEQMLRYRIDITINPPALNKSCKTGPLSTFGVHETNKQRRLAYYIRDVVAAECVGLVVEEVAILLGDPADLSMTVLVPDHKTIFQFVTEHLRSIEEIENTSTSHVSWRMSWMFSAAKKSSPGKDELTPN